mmetsp:Transcript_16038/g.33643  ORF Transcript_16038/g.33643 Transcript_16038/m.33643 type:complete len:119 (+) Transcript_16038:1343-1699(+)
MDLNNFTVLEVWWLVIFSQFAVGDDQRDDDNLIPCCLETFVSAKLLCVERRNQRFDVVFAPDSNCRFGILDIIEGRKFRLVTILNLRSIVIIPSGGNAEEKYVSCNKTVNKPTIMAKL